MPPILSRKRLPTAAWSTSLTRFSMEPTMEMTRGARVSGTSMRTWRSMEKTKPSLLLAMMGSRRASRPWAPVTSLAQSSLRFAVSTTLAS